LRGSGDFSPTLTLKSHKIPQGKLCRNQHALQKRSFVTEALGV
jgi:hypothetical protein